MKRAILFFAEGFEEIEAITPADILNRAGIRVITAGVGSKTVKGANGLSIKCDILAAEADDIYDAVVLPGGMPGAANLKNCPDVNRVIEASYKNGSLIGAICAAPAVVLFPLGLLANHEATCYPGFEKRFDSSVRFSEKGVVDSDNIITARGPGKAYLFGLELARYLTDDSIVDQIRSASLYV